MEGFSEKTREYFPSLNRVNSSNQQIIYLDGPGGTQVPIQVIEAISKYYLRSNANATHPDIGPQFSQPHVDHTYPHANLIVYLSGDGPTYVDGEKYEFEENDAILFYGHHFQARPKKDRRVVLVATLMGFESAKQD